MTQIPSAAELDARFSEELPARLPKPLMLTG